MPQGKADAMTGSPSIRVFVVAAAVLLCFAASAPAKLLVPASRSGVTVMFADGWDLPDVNVQWSDAEAVLVVVRSDGARRVFDPEDLRGLRDASGRDITFEILPAWTERRLGAALQGRDIVESAPPPLRPDLRPAAPGEVWRFVFGLEAGFDKPLDGDFDGVEGGLGFDVRARLQLLGPVYLAGGYSWRSLGDRETAYYDLDQPAAKGIPALPYDQRSDDVRLTGLWGGLSLITGNDDPDAARFYIEGGVGRYEVEGFWTVGDDDAYLGYHAGVGLLIPIGPVGALDFGARGTRIMDLDFGYGGDDEHSLVGVHLGIDLLGR